MKYKGLKANIFNINFLLINWFWENFNKQDECCQRKKEKKEKKENLSWIGIINNNYSNSRIQTHLESGMNPFSSDPSFSWLIKK